MAASLVTVPDNMSYVNAFHALWKNSKPAGFFKNLPEQLELQEATVSTSEKVAQSFKKLNGTYVSYMGGRLIKTDFGKFPELKTSGYDQNYGIGSAQEALNKYNQIISSQRFGFVE